MTHFTNTNNPIDFPPQPDSYSLNNIEYAIQGQMVSTTIRMPEQLLETISKDQIKLDLALDIAKQLVYCKCMEFTSQKDIVTMDVTYRARIFAVPDTQVRILRVMQENNK